MRRSLLLLLLPLAAGCEDALGPAGGCAAQMTATRIAYGQPDSESPRESDGDVFRETWIYFPEGSDPGRTVTFRWGTSLDGCQVSEGSANAKIPSSGTEIIR